VATPIGNLADITLRALHVLHIVDAIACEDTRHTRSLLRAYGVACETLIAVHQHNEAEAAQHLIDRLTRGERIAYVSDAGTPGISDPGARLVAALHAVGLRCMPLPGASSITTALCVAGAISPTEDNGFVFAGFLPAKGAARATAVQQLALEARCTVLLEAPHRIATLAAELAPLGARPVTVARELTKQFEQITTCRADALAAWLAGDAQRSRGEFVLIIHPQSPPFSPLDDKARESQRVLCLLLAQLPLKTAVRLAADITQQPKNALYAQALALQQE